MKKVLKLLDKVVDCAASHALGLLVFSIVVLVFSQAFFRYVLGLSFMGTAELPKYAMIWCCFLGAGVVARYDQHINIDVVPMLIKNPKTIHVIRTLVSLLNAIICGVFVLLSYEYVAWGMRTGDITPGLTYPVWWNTGSMFVGAVLMMINYMVIFQAKTRKLISQTKKGS